MRRLNLTGNNFDSLVSRFRSKELGNVYPTPQEDHSAEARTDTNVNLQENDIDSLINDLVGIEPSEDVDDIIDDAADIIEESVAPQEEEVKEELSPEEEINIKIKDIERDRGDVGHCGDLPPALRRGGRGLSLSGPVHPVF